MGSDWKECAAAIAEQTDTRGGHDEWHHRVLPCASSAEPSRLAVHTTRLQDNSQLILLGEPDASDSTPSPLLGEILESISDCFFALDREGLFVYINTKAATFFGATRDALLGQSLVRVRPSDRRFDEAFEKVTKDGVAATYDARLPDEGVWIEVRAYPAGGGMACYFADVTERVSYQERITFMALHDPLTGLPNREYMQEQLVRAVARGRRGRPSTLLFMDMDRFKLVNDSVGHAAGDNVLVEFAAVVELCIRDEDMLARFGGDEFSLLLEGTGVEEAFIVCERIHQAVHEHEFCYGKHTFSLGVSIGMTLVDGTLDEGHVMALADDAMYEAKAGGGEQTRYRGPLEHSDAEPRE